VTNVKMLLLNLSGCTVQGRDKPVNKGRYPAGNLSSHFRSGIANFSRAASRGKY
jgi:hypothetical protein